jgi:hypothetical protein
VIVSLFKVYVVNADIFVVNIVPDGQIPISYPSPAGSNSDKKCTGISEPNSTPFTLKWYIILFPGMHALIYESTGSGYFTSSDDGITSNGTLLVGDISTSSRIFTCP